MLTKAVKQNDPSAVEKLLESGDMESLDQNLLYATISGYRDVVEKFLQFAIPEDAINRAFIAAATVGNKEIAELLLNYGAKPQARDNLALVRAAHNGHKDIVKLLLDEGANVHGRDGTALTVAAERGHKDIVRMLLQQQSGKKLKSIKTARELAKREGHNEIVSMLNKE